MGRKGNILLIINGEKKTFLNDCSPIDPAIPFAYSYVCWIWIRHQEGIVATLNVKTTLNVKNSYNKGPFLH